MPVDVLYHNDRGLEELLEGGSKPFDVATELGLTERCFCYLKELFYGLIWVDVLCRGNDIVDVWHGRHAVGVNAIWSTVAWRHAMPRITGHVRSNTRCCAVLRSWPTWFISSMSVVEGLASWSRVEARGSGRVAVVVEGPGPDDECLRKPSDLSMCREV